LARHSTLQIIGFAHFLSGRFDEAVPKLVHANQEDPSWSMPYCVLAACYAHMGRLDDAREIVMRLRAITSIVIPDDGFSWLRKPEHREMLLSGLRLAAGDATRASKRRACVDGPLGARGERGNFASVRLRS
jgi:hypothetical protein